MCEYIYKIVYLHIFFEQFPIFDNVGFMLTALFFFLAVNVLLNIINDKKKHGNVRESKCVASGRNRSGNEYILERGEAEIFGDSLVSELILGVDEFVAGFDVRLTGLVRVGDLRV